jgi:Uncharacterized protein conserved in bacteria
MEVKIKGIYKHYKGDFYIVEDIATHTEMGGRLVIYRSLYGDTKLWARPYDMFTEKIDKEKTFDSDQEYKFELQEIKSVKDK